MEKEKLLELIGELIEKYRSKKPVPIEESKFLKELIERIKKQ